MERPDRQLAMEGNYATQGSLRGLFLQDDMASALADFLEAQPFEPPNRLLARDPAELRHV